MTGASGQHRNIASLHDHLVSVLSTQHQPRGTAGEPEHFMCSRVIVMEVVHSVSPLRRPAIARKQLLEARRRIRTPRVLDTAIKQHGKMFVVRHPAVAREAQHLRISGCSICTSFTSRIGSVPDSGRRPETQSPEQTHESSSVHEYNPFWRRTASGRVRKGAWAVLRGLPLWCALLAGLGQCAPHSLGIEVGRVNRCARLLAPGFIKAASINGIESELVHKPDYGLLCVLVIAGHGQGDPSSAASRAAALQQVLGIDVIKRLDRPAGRADAPPIDFPPFPLRYRQCGHRAPAGSNCPCR